MSEPFAPLPEGSFEANWDSLANCRVPAWYVDGKFGIFIHWGVYSVPGFSSEWYPRVMYEQGSKEFAHHVATYGPHNRNRCMHCWARAT